MAYAAGGGGGGWTSTNVMDMDIMPLPLTYEDEPVGGPSSRALRDSVVYKPWDGPDTYIPGSFESVHDYAGCSHLVFMMMTLLVEALSCPCWQSGRV
jgi:hypothetical protein